MFSLLLLSLDRKERKKESTQPQVRIFLFNLKQLQQCHSQPCSSQILSEMLTVLQANNSEWCKVNQYRHFKDTTVKPLKSEQKSETDLSH